jgi:protocatechuate 3,4-dioxygenase beta subunit
MRDFTEQTLTDAVLQRLGTPSHPRLRQLMQGLIRHLHDFVRETDLTEAEWFEAIRFLTETGKMCDDVRQEFILLSGTLGISMLVDAVTHQQPAGATDTTILGPFYRDGAPDRDLGETIAPDISGEPAFVAGRVTDPAGRPIPGARLDVWQAAPNGLYEGQDPEMPAFNMRGRFRADAQGRYHFATVKPASYPIPMDGPVGQLMRALGRQPYRPAHIHFIVAAPGYETLTTHIFVKGDPCLDTDPVFAVKSSLIADFVRHDSAAEAMERKTTAPFYTVEYDFGLKPSA